MRLCTQTRLSCFPCLSPERARWRTVLSGPVKILTPGLIIAPWRCQSKKRAPRRKGPRRLQRCAACAGCACTGSGREQTWDSAHCVLLCGVTVVMPVERAERAPVRERRQQVSACSRRLTSRATCRGTLPAPRAADQLRHSPWLWATCPLSCTQLRRATRLPGAWAPAAAERAQLCGHAADALLLLRSPASSARLVCRRRLPGCAVVA